jgi:hypothetical protein
MRVPREEGRDVEREAAQAAPTRQAPADRVLALQSTAGNRAVAAMLARDPDAPVQADAKDAPKDKKPAAPSGMHVTLGGLGTIALESATIQGSGPGGGSGGTGRGRDQERQPPREIILSSKLGEHSAALQRALVDGKPMDGEIVLSGVKIVVKGAVVSSYSTSEAGGGKEPMEAWTINVQSIEFVKPPTKDDEAKPDRSAWDLAEQKGS